MKRKEVLAFSAIFLIILIGVFSTGIIAVEEVVEDEEDESEEDEDEEDVNEEGSSDESVTDFSADDFSETESNDKGGVTGEESTNEEMGKVWEDIDKEYRNDEINTEEILTSVPYFEFILKNFRDELENREE